VAVIGCGQIGTRGHLPAFAGAAQAGLCTLVGVCDVDRRRAEAAARPYGLPAFASTEALLARLRPDVVSIATLPSSHRALVLQALDAGCHVLCEKPVAMHAGEAAEMVAAAERAGRLLSICFEYRYWDEAVFLRERIAAGHLGGVHSVRTWGGAVDGFPRRSNRYHLSSAGGGVLTHWTIHNLDLALWLLGNPEPLTASAFCLRRRRHRRGPGGGAPPPRPQVVDPEVEDFAVGMVRLPGDAVLTVEANWRQPPSRRPEGWELLGDRGAASISPLRVWADRGGRWVDETPPPGTLAPCDYDMGRLMAGFLERVRAGGPAPVSGPEIERIQRLMDALYESARQEREVVLAASTG
jgi:predicted dehydrogenase